MSDDFERMDSLVPKELDALMDRVTQRRLEDVLGGPILTVKEVQDEHTDGQRDARPDDGEPA